MARFAHIPLDEASGTTARVDGSETHPDLVSSSSDDSQWQDDWWVGNGIDRCLSYSFTEDTAVDVFLPGEGVCLFAMALELTETPVDHQHALAIGYRDDSGNHRGILVSVTPAGQITLELHDDATPPAHRENITTSATLPLGTPVGICCFVDNRSDGANTAAIYQYQLGSTLVDIGALKELSSLVAISAEPANVRQRIQIGCRFNELDQPEGWLSGKLRRISVWNFGTNPVPNLHELMAALSKGEMDITDEVRQIAGISTKFTPVQFVSVQN